MCLEAHAYVHLAVAVAAAAAAAAIVQQIRKEYSRQERERKNYSIAIKKL